MPKGIVLNVNIPKLPKEEIKGVKVCKQANAKWEESFDERVNPHGKKYYWLTGYLPKSVEILKFNVQRSVLETTPSVLPSYGSQAIIVSFTIFCNSQGGG